MCSEQLRELMDRGRQLEEACNPESVDCYFAVAKATAGHSPSSCELHRESLQRLVIAGQKLGRFNPGAGLRVLQDGKETCIPIQRHGFVWSSEEFQRLDVVGDYSTNAVRCLHQNDGVGIPVVVSNNNPLQRPLLQGTIEFSATLVLEFDDCASLVLYDPKRCTNDRHNMTLARDLSAAYAFRLKGERSGLIEEFITDPVTSGGSPKLSLIEPYQPGKVPVILVHGLLSNPFTWMQTLTDLESNSWYVENFQTLVFRYPSGQSFLATAAELREQLAHTRSTFDPEGTDPAVTNSVVVGHSLGGLLAKLLVTESRDDLWNAISNKPVDSVHVPAQFEGDVLRAFFFKPSAEVSRVVFIGTPHKGSSIANRLLGRVASSLVELPEEARGAHQELIACNPDTFTREVTRRIPTSIDFLEPDSRLLLAVGNLPVHPRVQMHSIIGDSRWGPLAGKSDGVVPVDSAMGVASQSEVFVDEHHTELHQHPHSRDELLRILKLHLESCHH